MPSIVPEESGPIQFVFCDFGSAGRVYVETDPITATAATIVEDMLDGQYDQPLKVFAVDLTANRVEDVSAKIARAILDEAERRRQAGACSIQTRTLSQSSSAPISA